MDVVGVSRGLLDAGSESLESYWQSDQMVETLEETERKGIIITLDWRLLLSTYLRNDPLSHNRFGFFLSHF